MRLTCPNCDAEYSVDDAAIPPGGRDVQCSNCGHAWFQLHPDAEAAAASADALFGPARRDGEAAAKAGMPAPPPPTPHPVPPEAATPIAPPIASPAETSAEVPSNAEGEDEDRDEDQPTAVSAQPAVPPMATAAGPMTPTRSLDENLLAILREEAARETAVRRSEAPAMPEVQPDLGLTGAAPAPVAAAAEATPPATADLDAIEAGGAAMHDRVAPRRDLLPDIEEINSTLRAGSEARGAQAEAMVLAEKARARGGFRAGFLFTLVVAVLLTVGYTMAPRIAEHLPGSAPVMASYVASIDVARLWLDDTMQQAVGALRGLTGETP